MSEVIQFRSKRANSHKLFSALEENLEDNEILMLLKEMQKENMYEAKDISRFANWWIEKSGSRKVFKKLIEMGADCEQKSNGYPLWQKAFCAEVIAFAPRLMDLIIAEILNVPENLLAQLNEYIDQACAEHEDLLEESFRLMEVYGREPDLSRIALDKKYDEMVSNLLDKCNSLAGY